jgi:methyltransferase (TIGR00027 family)
MRLVHGFGLAFLLVAIASSVEPGLPSKTSIYTATGRAIGAKHPDPVFRNPDYLAIKLLGPHERAILNDFPMDALDLDYDRAIQRLDVGDRDFITTQFLRTRYIDDTMNEALRDGANQVVILGAGFDSRGYRFADRLRRVRFFEVDYGPTQEHKKGRVTQALGTLPDHVRYIPVDFTKDDLLTELRNGGYAEHAKTLFIWEGVTQYIPQASIKQTLHFVRDHAAPSSSISYSLMF